MTKSMNIVYYNTITVKTCLRGAILSGPRRTFQAPRRDAADRICPIMEVP